jgi:glucokinase
MYSAAFDIGGTQLRAAVFDEERRLTDVFKTTNDKELGAEKNIDKLIDFIKSHDYDFCGVGIASPGPLDLRRGMILNPPNLVGWDNFEIVKYVEMKTGLPTDVNNDGNLAGLAEARLGEGAGYDSVVFIGMSTGLGGSYVYKGNLINGAHFNAAEFYNVIVCDDTYHHGSANPGSLNELAGGVGIGRLGTEKFGQPMTARDVFAKYNEGDSRAAEVLEFTSEVLARGISNIYYTIDPDIYIIGGSIALFNPWYVEKVLAKAKGLFCSYQ